MQNSVDIDKSKLYPATFLMNFYNEELEIEIKKTCNKIVEAMESFVKPEKDKENLRDKRPSTAFRRNDYGKSCRAV